MTMTNEEICRSFRQEATPRKQIGILAEMNQCDKSRIVEILREGGETLPAPYKNADAGDAAAAGRRTGETDCHGAAPLAMTGATGSDDYREAEHDPLPAADPEKQAEIIRAETDNREAMPWLISMEEQEKGRVARAAVEVIDKLLRDFDGFYGEGSGDAFAEQVRGVLKLAWELLGEATE